MWVRLKKYSAISWKSNGDDCFETVKKFCLWTTNLGRDIKKKLINKCNKYISVQRNYIEKKYIILIYFRYLMHHSANTNDLFTIEKLKECT